MFHTLSNIQRGEPVGLQQYIDNHKGNLQVGLHPITYTVGWYNVNVGESFSWQHSKGQAKTLSIAPGLWSFSMLEDLFESANANITLQVSKAAGLMSLTVLSGWEVMFMDGPLALLGLDDRGLEISGLRLGILQVTDRSTSQLQNASTYILTRSTPPTMSWMEPPLHSSQL